VIKRFSHASKSISAKRITEARGARYLQQAETDRSITTSRFAYSNTRKTGKSRNCGTCMSLAQCSALKNSDTRKLRVAVVCGQSFFF
jgi:hypothetical protein